MSRLTRRSVVAGATLAAIPLSALPVSAERTADPIFALIERHRRLWRELGEAIRATGEVEDAHRAEDGDLPDDDHPAVAPYKMAEHEVSDALYECQAALAQIVPTTAAGLVAIIAYAREHQHGPNKGEPLFYASGVDEDHSLATWLGSLQTAALALAAAT
jgi:hypothetical protein